MPFLSGACVPASATERGEDAIARCFVVATPHRTLCRSCFCRASTPGFLLKPTLHATKRDAAPVSFHHWLLTSLETAVGCHPWALDGMRYHIPASSAHRGASCNLRLF